jgi:transposase
MVAGLPGAKRRRGRRVRPAGQHHRPRPSAQRGGAKKRGGDEAIGRSRGGLSTKIHATADALGNPTGLHLTGGATHDLAGADALLPQVAAATVIADRGYDAEGRVLAVLRDAGKVAVIPPKRHRKDQRDFDRDLYAARYLIEHFFCRLKQYRAIATRYDKTARNFLAAVQLVASAILLN